MDGTETKQRFNGIDALRGLAVILMVEQHMGIWLWKQPPGPIKFSMYPLIVGFNAMGGFAAPAFITLAGLSVVLFLSRYTEMIDRTLVSRGLMIILLGYFLNLIIPSWFSAGSWYVLHMIGFGILVTPLLRRLPLPGLFVLAISILVMTVFLQNMLNTPNFLSNSRMRNTHMTGGVFRLALAEGQFPIFPWITYFIAGMAAGRWILEEKTKNITILASAILGAGILFSSLYFLKFDFALYGPLARAFKLHLGFYPSSITFVLLMLPVVLYAIVLFQTIDKRINFQSGNPLVCLGRISLTLLMLHIFFVREMGHHLHFWKLFSTTQTLLIITAFLSCSAYAAIHWRKKGYPFGAEWLIRRFG